MDQQNCPTLPGISLVQTLHHYRSSSYDPLILHQPFHHPVKGIPKDFQHQKVSSLNHRCFGHYGSHVSDGEHCSYRHWTYGWTSPRLLRRKFLRMVNFSFTLQYIHQWSNAHESQKRRMSINSHQNFAECLHNLSGLFGSLTDLGFRWSPRWIGELAWVYSFV